MTTHASAHPGPRIPTRSNVSFMRLVEGVTPSVLTQGELALAVGTTERTVQNWNAGRTRPRGEAVDRVLDVVHVVHELREVYTDEGIQIWLHSRNRNLGHRRPIDLLAEERTDEVLAEVERVLSGM